MRSPSRGRPRRHDIRGPIAAVLFLTACSAPAHRSPQPELPDGELRARGRLKLVETRASPAFGDSVLGKAAWMSSNGRFALLFLVTRDTDGNGRIEAQFGQHGEPQADEPRPWLFEIDARRGVEYDEIREIDAADRVAVLRKGTDIFVVDTETPASSVLADTRSLVAADSNRCLPPRQLALDPHHPRVALLSGEPPRLTIRELRGGSESTITSRTEYLWRVRFTSTPDWLELLVIDHPQPGRSVELPRQNTSCACRYCNLFALSHGFYGWEGPAFRSILVAPDGQQIPTAPSPTPIGRGAYAITDSSAVFRTDGVRIDLPSGCDSLEVIAGASRMMLRCREGVRLFDPETRREVRLAKPVQLPEDAVALTDASGVPWAPVLLPLASETAATSRSFRLGRVRIADGRMELGPRVEKAIVSSNGKIVVGAHRGTAYPVDILAGEYWEVPLDELVWTDGVILAGEADHSLIVVLESGQYFVGKPRTFVAAPVGCILEAASEVSRVDRGPWVRRCAVRSP